MIDDPLPKVDAFVQAGADMITFHLEGARQPHRVLQELAGATNVNDPARGLIRGVGLNPSTPIEAIEPLLDDLEYVLIVAINPGWGGQILPAGGRGRLERARRTDRGVRPADPAGRGRRRDARPTSAEVAGLGADIIVSGSAIFDGTDVMANAARHARRGRRRARPQPGGRGDDRVERAIRHPGPGRHPGDPRRGPARRTARRSGCTGPSS